MSDPSNPQPTDPSAPPSDATTAADERDAHAPHSADRPPTEDEERAAPTEVDAEVGEAHRRANERGANVQGEGQIDGDPGS